MWAILPTKLNRAASQAHEYSLSAQVRKMGYNRASRRASGERLDRVWGSELAEIGD